MMTRKIETTLSGNDCLTVIYETKKPNQKFEKALDSFMSTWGLMRTTTGQFPEIRQVNFYQGAKKL